MHIGVVCRLPVPGLPHTVCYLSLCITFDIIYILLTTIRPNAWNFTIYTKNIITKFILIEIFSIMIQKPQYLYLL